MAGVAPPKTAPSVSLGLAAMTVTGVRIPEPLSGSLLAKRARLRAVSLGLAAVNVRGVACPPRASLIEAGGALRSRVGGGAAAPLFFDRFASLASSGVAEAFRFRRFLAGAFLAAAFLPWWGGGAG